MLLIPFLPANHRPPQMGMTPGLTYGSRPEHSREPSVLSPTGCWFPWSKNGQPGMKEALWCPLYSRLFSKSHIQTPHAGSGCLLVFPGGAGRQGLVVAEFPQVFQALVASDSIDLVMIEVQKHLGLHVNWEEAESTIPNFIDVDTQAHRAAGSCPRPHRRLAAEARVS